MKLHQNTRNIERGGIRVEREATIVADAVAFKVLSDMLYPDKPLAIIRELLCNAYDSHTAAGTPDLPVHMHLPNALEPYLSIRDFGLGLSFRDACVLMLTYFKSTKRDSNDVTGALGLGSKTPFSYVDSYTVTSWYNGRKFVFNAFINERGNPSMAMLARERTTEPNGVEIMMPVRRSDYYLFVERAQTVLEWFRVQPVVTGVKDFKPNIREYELEGTGWKIAKTEYHRYGYRNSGQAYAVQGNIAYPINVDSMPNLPTGYADLLRQPIVMTFPIGHISFTAGRDAASYDKGTVQNIISALDTLVKEVPEKWQSKFDQCKTMWEARCTYATLIGDGNSSEVLRILNNHKKLSFKWNGQDVNMTTASIHMKDFKDPVVTVLYSNSSKSKRYTTNDPVNITASSSTKFYIDDLPKGAITRLRSYRYQNQPNYDIFLLTTDTSDVKEKRKAIDSMLEQLGNPEYILASTLPVKKRNTTTMGKRTGRIVEVSNVLTGSNVFMENLEDIDMDDGGFYIPMYRGVAQDGNATPLSNFFQVIKQAANLQFITKSDTIIGVTTSQLAKFKSNDSWVNVMDHIKEKFLEQANASTLLNDLASDNAFQDMQYGPSYRLFNAWAGANASVALGKDHPVSIFVDEYAKKSRVVKNRTVDDLTKLAGMLNLTIDAKNGVVAYRFVDKFNELMTRYPMIKIISYPDTAHGKMFIEYIKQVDTVSKLEQSNVIKLEIAN